MKKLILFSSGICLFLSKAYSQAPEIEWQKCYGGSKDDVANSIIQTSDGGYIVAGNTRSNDGDASGNHGRADYWVVELKSNGAVDWQKTYGGSKDAVANSIIQTNDGGYIVAGFTTSNDSDVNGNHGYADIWVVKLKSTGAIDWQKTYGGRNQDYANSIIQTSDGGYIVAGYTKSNDSDVSGNHGDWDYLVVKLKSNGAIDWQKTYGGSKDDAANSIIQTNDGGYIVAGSTWSNDSDRNSDYWVVKLKNTGAIDWQKTYGGSRYDVANSIIQTSDGGYIIAGETSSNDGDVSVNHGDGDYWVLKLKSNGAIDWQKTYGGSRYDVANSIIQTSDGGYIVAGYTKSNDGDVSGNHGYYDYWLVKLKTNGAINWQKTYGGGESDVANSIIQASDGGYIVAGYTLSNDKDVRGNHGGADYWVVKLKSK